MRTHAYNAVIIMNARIQSLRSSLRRGIGAAIFACAATATASPVPSVYALPGTVPVSKAATAPAAGTRGRLPLRAVSGPGAGQAGYVHYFLLRMPDESLEVQVGIELEDQRIAWAFPDLGVVVSAFPDGDSLQAGERSYGIWHLYGLRPFPEDATMQRLQKALPGRIAPWIRAGIPYCLDDAAQGNCMSCIGFVLRTLFPGRGSNAYPDMPRDFWRTRMGSRYTPNDLLLYLAGMLDLPNRNARLQRLNRLELPPDLRLDLEDLVHAIGAHETAPPDALHKRAGGSPAKRPQL